MGIEELTFGDTIQARMTWDGGTNDYSLSIAFCDKPADREDYESMLNRTFEYFVNYLGGYGKQTGCPNEHKPHAPFGYIFKNEDLTAKFEYREFSVRIKPFVRFLLCYTGKDKISIDGGLNFLIKNYFSLKEPFIGYYDLSEIDSAFENLDISAYLKEKSKEPKGTKVPINALEQTKEIQVQKSESKKANVIEYELSKSEVEFFGKYYPNPITQAEVRRFKDKFNCNTVEGLRNNEGLKRFNKFIDTLLDYKRDV